MHLEIDPDVPREPQTIRLSESKLASFREWALEGIGLTAAVRLHDSAGRIALVRNRWSEGWVLPGGSVEPGEDPVEAARREVLEEIGLRASIHGPLVVLEQTYVAERDGTARFSADYVVFSGFADGDIPDADRLGTSRDEIRAARWFETLPEDLHDGDSLRPYL